jgi:F420-dependent oxidoreductase-like protein
MDRVYVVDHFMPFAPGVETVSGPVLECWTSLTALVGETSRIRLGTLVLGNTYRHPAVVANMAATLDQVSGGRLVLGLGAGWQENEHVAYGIELPPPRERLDRHEEAVQIIRSLLTEEVTNFAGRHYRLSDARCEPRPVQPRLPILMGGSGERRSIPMAGRLADEWHSWANPDTFSRRCGVLDDACSAAGRSPDEVRRVTGQQIEVRPHVVDDGDDIIGPVTHVLDRLGAYDESGADEMIVRDHARLPVREALANLTSLGGDVVPHLP